MIGKNLLTLRTRAGISQPELAKNLGVTQGCVGHWERGRKRMTCERMIQIADALHVEPAAIFDPDYKSCIIRADHPCANLLKQALLVLESNTHFAKALEQNIESFYMALETNIAMKNMKTTVRQEISLALGKKIEIDLKVVPNKKSKKP